MQEEKEYQNSNGTYIQELDIVKPSLDALTAVCITNGIIEVKIHEYGYQGNLSRYRKISKTSYVDVETGEIVQLQSKTNKNITGSSGKRNWNRSFERLRRIINNNFVGNRSELHIVLTYSRDRPASDRDVIADDFKKFWKRLKYVYGSLDYIVMYEPHFNGRWHIHLLVKDSSVKTLFIDNNSVQKIWGLGYTIVRRTSGNDNIGVYFTIMLGGENKTKKSSRIQYYAKYKRLYSKSRGIIIPPLQYMTYREAELLLRGHKKVYEKGYSIRAESDGCELNRIYIQQFNDRRTKK